MYIEVMSLSYKEKCPHAGVAPRDVLLQELSIKKDSYQYDIKLMHDEHSPTWHKMDINAKHA